MRNFEFFFEGTVNANGTIEAGVKILSGDAVEVALTLGAYASEQLKRGEPCFAIIVINAFKRMMELNPDMGKDILEKLEFTDGARIIAPRSNFIPPFKKN
jgi:hypothetical protein